jgi:hypothetical protein
VGTVPDSHTRSSNFIGIPIEHLSIPLRKVARSRMCPEASPANGALLRPHQDRGSGNDPCRIPQVFGVAAQGFARQATLSQTNHAKQKRMGIRVTPPIETRHYTTTGKELEIGPRALAYSEKRPPPARAAAGILGPQTAAGCQRFKSRRDAGKWPHLAPVFVEMAKELNLCQRLCGSMTRAKYDAAPASATIRNII